jgi:hypothetical protein
MSRRLPCHPTWQRSGWQLAQTDALAPSVGPAAEDFQPTPACAEEVRLPELSCASAYIGPHLRAAAAWVAGQAKPSCSRSHTRRSDVVGVSHRLSEFSIGRHGHTWIGVLNHMGYARRVPNRSAGLRRWPAKPAGNLRAGTCLYSALTSTPSRPVNPLMVLSKIGVVYMVLTSNHRDHVVLNLSRPDAGPEHFGSDWSASVNMRRGVHGRRFLRSCERLRDHFDRRQQ